MVPNPVARLIPEKAPDIGFPVADVSSWLPFEHEQLSTELPFQVVPFRRAKLPGHGSDQVELPGFNLCMAACAMFRPVHGRAPRKDTFNTRSVVRLDAKEAWPLNGNVSRFNDQAQADVGPWARVCCGGSVRVDGRGSRGCHSEIEDETDVMG